MRTSFFGSANVSTSGSSFPGGPNWSREPLTNSFGFVQERRKSKSYARSSTSVTGQSQSNQRRDPRSGQPLATHCRAKRKSSKDDRQRVLAFDPIEGCAHIVNFSNAMRMLPFAESSATEIEAEHWESEVVQRLHGVEDNFVVQRPAIDRMRMTDL